MPIVIVSKFGERMLFEQYIGHASRVSNHGSKTRVSTNPKTVAERERLDRMRVEEPEKYRRHQERKRQNNWERHQRLKREKST